MKEFNEFVSEEAEDTSKQDLIILLNDVSEQCETPLENELVNLIVSMVKMDKIAEEDYDSVYDAIDEIVEFETSEMKIDYDSDEDEDEEVVDEAQRPLYKRKGYVKCPNGRIRKRGKCGKPVDKQKSRKMVKARKRFKKSFQLGARKTKRTKRKLGMQK